MGLSELLGLSFPQSPFGGTDPEMNFSIVQTMLICRVPPETDQEVVAGETRDRGSETSSTSPDPVLSDPSLSDPYGCEFPLKRDKLGQKVMELQLGDSA